MSNPQVRRFLCLCAVILCMSAAGARADRVPGDCPTQDLSVVLNTGWDEETGGALIASGDPDDDWSVLVDPSASTLPGDPAEVITAHPAWSTLPDSKWIAADKYGPNGIYIYETCWCMDDDFINPVLDFEIRADDNAVVRLNGGTILTLPDGTFNDTIAPSVTVSDPMAFQVGQNCLTVEVENKYGVVTGFNMAGDVTADDGLCCGCDAQDIADDASTGVDDAASSPIPTGGLDDEWVVTGSPSGGVLPRMADVIDTFAGWNVIPGTKWITADETGPNGLYTYENCWCMNESFSNPQLTVELLADDRADVFLNGTLLGSTPPSNAFLFPTTVLSTSQPNRFRAGENCLTIEVRNTSSVVTGLNVKADFTADDAECCDCVPLPADAEAWWPLDETSGTTSAEIFNGHDGTHSELVASAPPPTPVPGYVDGALQFDGVDDYVAVPDDPGLDFGPNDDLTIDAWINTTSLIRMPIVHKKGFPFNSPGYTFHVGGGLVGFETADSANTNVCVGTTVLNDGDWHFVAVTLDRANDTVVLYVDGAVDATCTVSPIGSMVNADEFRIGGTQFIPPDGMWWDGELDEIELFRRALTLTEIEDLYLAGNAGKCDPTPCEDATGLPVCDGACPTGQVCEGTLQGPDPCHCMPETVPCMDSQFPVCMGDCPPGQTCQIGPAQDCACQPIQGGGSCQNSPYPECNGTCDQGGTCEPVAQGVCDCVLPPPCDQSPYPVCGGDCPPGQVCAEGPAQDCFCQPEPHCGDVGDYPECGLPCPPGFVCEQGPNQNCVCVEEFPACGDTEYPECNGDCPQGEECVNELGTDNCFCQPLSVACGDNQFPQCGGDCPPDQKCMQKIGGGGCECVTCVVAGGSGLGGIGVVWPSDKDQIRWTENVCASVYNTYRGSGIRLPDPNHDGLADDYGDCYQDDIIGLDAPVTDTPQVGTMDWYLVTGENSTAEGSLGAASDGRERPNPNVCP